jgi:hypothetical protein
MPAARAIAVALLLVGLTACDSDSGGSATPPTKPAGSTAAPSPRLESHPIILSSEAGRQRAALAPCLRVKLGTDPDPPVCEEYVAALRPTALSVVRLGESVTISFPGASVENPSGCTKICGATGTARPLDCTDKPLGGFQLLDGSSIRWEVDLPPGRYELDVYGNLRTNDGRKVFTTGDFGLIVDDARPLEIVAADLPPCPASS